MRSDPLMTITCDGLDCQNDIEVSLTSLAGNGWDDRNVKGYLKRNHWTTAGGKDFCDECESTT